jgi:long-chain fatty acid transport protein
MVPHRVGLSLALTSTILVTGQQANAAGFAIREQSSLAQGNAFAGATAAAEDISYMFFNPAALARFDDYQGHASLSYIIPEAKFKNGEASTIAGTEITGTDNRDDIAEDALVPALYLAAPLATGVQFGLGITAPFGLVTDNEDGWIGRYQALKSDLTTVDINPTLAIQASPQFSFGLGLRVQYADLELTNAIDFGTIGALSGNGALAGISQPTQQDGEARVKVDDWGVGWSAGFLFEPTASTRFGIAYKSEIDHDAKGDAEFDLGTRGVGAAISQASGQFVDTGASLSVSTPASLSFGAYHELSSQFALMGEIAWTDWSSFDELRVEFDNQAQDDSVTEEKWEDSFFVAAGASYQALPDLTIRGGIAYDESPIPDEFRTPRVAGNDRYWVSLGADYQLFSGVGISASYTHIFVDDGDIDLQATDEGSTFRGNLSGVYENQIDIITLSGTVRF